MLRTCSSVPCAVPDLTFSEMTFLNPRKDKPEEPVISADQKKRRKKDKTADTEAEISRYFASAKARDSDPTIARKERARGLETSRAREKFCKRSEAEEFAYLGRSSLPPVELPERPFLGFGSVGGSLVSPVRKSDFPVSPPRRSHPTQRDLSPSRSTSYFSWSKTRSPSHRSSRPRENESVSPVPPKEPQIIADLITNNNISQKISPGVPLPCEDDVVDNRETRKRKTSHGCSEDITTIPGGGVSKDPQEQNLGPPPSDSHLEQRQAQIIGPQLVEKSKTPQHQQTAAAHGSNNKNAPTDPPLTELNDLKPKRPEDLVNATLKLLLEKFGASTAGHSAAVGIANETPKSPNAATNDNGPRVSPHHVLSLTKDGGGEAMEKGSSQGEGHGMDTSPRPFSRRTVPSEAQLTEKPSRQDYPSDDVTKVALHTQGAFQNSQAPRSPADSLHPSQYRRTDAKSAWNGYDAIYERQSMSEAFQSNRRGNQILCDPNFDGYIMNHPVTTSEYDLEDRHSSGFDDTYDDCGPRKPDRCNAYGMQIEAQSYQDQVERDGMRSQQLNEPYRYGRSVEALDERFLTGEDGYLPEEEPPFAEYALPERGQIASSMGLVTRTQCATQDGSRGYLPFQRKMLRDEPRQALYSRPHTQGSDHGSVQQNLMVPLDQTVDASLLGFWKPHRLY